MSKCELICELLDGLGTSAKCVVSAAGCASDIGDTALRNELIHVVNILWSARDRVAKKADPQNKG